ncbi:MAG: hypothetical protein O3A51_03460 [Verrucomicrobia bacterium]|nr:hypothetical protein [Verrucomicrobiota bacterium]
MTRYTAKDHVVLRHDPQTKRGQHTVANQSTSATGADQPIEEFGTVVAHGERGTLLVRTSNGRTRQLRPDDPRLRRATVLEEIFQSGRFPRLWWQ